MITLCRQRLGPDPAASSVIRISAGENRGLERVHQIVPLRSDILVTWPIHDIKDAWIKHSDLFGPFFVHDICVSNTRRQVFWGESTVSYRFAQEDHIVCIDCEEPNGCVSPGTGMHAKASTGRPKGALGSVEVGGNTNDIQRCCQEALEHRLRRVSRMQGGMQRWSMMHKKPQVRVQEPGEPHG